jgi:CRISPR-associated protein Csd1
MLTELILLSERMKFTGSEPFVKRDIHWVIDLDSHGTLKGISPTAKPETKQKKKSADKKGKSFRCPSAFHMVIGKSGEIGAAAGGGNVPTLLGVGRTVEIFGAKLKQEKGRGVQVVQVGSDSRKGEELEGGDLGIGDEENEPDEKNKDVKRNKNFLRLHERFAENYPQNPVAFAVLQFLRAKPELQVSDFFPVPAMSDKESGGDEQNTTSEVEKKSDKTNVKTTDVMRLNGEYLTFRVDGKLLLKDKDFIEWWERYYDDQKKAVLKELKDGTDLISEPANRLGKLTVRFPNVERTANSGEYRPFAAFDKDPFESYGLGATTTPLLLENAEKITAAFNWLLREDNHHLNLGSDLTSIFWAVVDLSPLEDDEKPKFSAFARLLNEKDSLQVRNFLTSPFAGRFQETDPMDFYAAILFWPKSRVVVRSWHTSTLPMAERHIRKYFKALNLAGKDDSEIVVYPISLLADITIPPRKKSDKAKPQKAKPQPDTYIALFETALFGERLPHKLLTKALQRQSLELAKGTDKKGRNDFERRLAARTALIKLYFKSTKGVDMTPDKHLIENDSAYLCGRLLAMLDRIHTEAHKQSGGTNTSPANRVYGSASTTPALAFPQLCKMARHHLNKLGGGMARNLEFGVKRENRTDGINEDFEGLADIVARLLKSPKQEFPRTLNLEEQGRFAIGFYYERSLPIPRTSKRKDSGNSADTENQTTVKGEDDNEQ